MRSSLVAVGFLAGIVVTERTEPAVAKAAPERVAIDAAAVGAPISPLIYGQFIEHLGRCIYGGLWVGEGSKIPNIRGFRRDVIGAAKAGKPGIVRYPGGNFASAYHWEDGVGPRDQRPRRWDPTWKCE